MQIFAEQCAVIADPTLLRHGALADARPPSHHTRPRQAGAGHQLSQLREGPGVFVRAVHGAPGKRSGGRASASRHTSTQCLSPPQDLLGTGLVTSDGALWAKQRKMVSSAFRVDILDDIVVIAAQAVERLARAGHAVPSRPRQG